MMLKGDRLCTDSTMDVVLFRYGAKLRKFECGNHYWKVMWVSQVRSMKCTSKTLENLSLFSYKKQGPCDI